jgi:hypothetical protein
MRACSRGDAGAFIAGGVSVLLGIFFWLPTGRGSVSLMPPVSLEGKSWVLHESAPPQPEPPRQPATPPKEAGAEPKETPRAPHRRGARKAAADRARKRVEPPAAKPPLPETTAAAQAVSLPDGKQNSAVAVAVVVPPATLDPLQQYAMQELIDGFESDPSKYPLERTVRTDGVALTLEGLQRREKLVVLKVAISNGNDADFFIKDFTVRAGATILGSRSLFRILVEPQRVREGYVVFEKPPSGAAVQIKLKEDGGKGRSLESGVPYRF